MSYESNEQGMSTVESKFYKGMVVVGLAGAAYCGYALHEAVTEPAHVTVSSSSSNGIETTVTTIHEPNPLTPVFGITGGLGGALWFGMKLASKSKTPTDLPKI